MSSRAFVDVNEQMQDLAVKANQTPGRQGSLVDAFERIAEVFPSRIAVSSGIWQPTYRELNETANRLAHRLMNSGVGLGSRVAILMSHDAPMIAAIVAATKAGQIVVALDPSDPLPRLTMLVQDAEPSIIVVDVANLNLAAEFAPPGCNILSFEQEVATGPVENPSIEVPPEQTAVLNYTSGSTGRPKGVMRTHRQLCRAAAVHTQAMQSTEKDRITLLASISTAQGMSFLWWILLNGATVCPFPVKTKGVTGLADWIVDRGVTVYGSSASIFRTLVKTLDNGLVFSNLRLVWLGSEGVAAGDLRAFQKHLPPTSVLVHGYSSSETSIIAWSRWTQSDIVPEGLLPVGHFARDIDVSLIGDDGQPVENGEVGEIVVKNRYGVGYWRDPKLTAERLSVDLDGNGTRLVRTGDLGRINDDGLLELRGRKDDRVKIRGNRIELGEIDRALEKLPGVEHAAAVAVPRKIHEPMLVAFIVKASDASWTAPRLRQTLRASLPLHMVPSRIVFLDGLPYNRGNKVDREALRHYASPARADGKDEEPRTETEMLLADIWAESLELLDVGRNDDFFDLGGDSLTGAVVAAQVHAMLGVELSLGTIADYPTMSTLASHIDKCRGAGAASTPPIVGVPRAAAMPLSPCQESYWPHRGAPLLTHVQRSCITGSLDVEIYKDCLIYLVRRHEILRTTFGIVDGRPAQIIHPSAAVGFTFIDLAGQFDPEGQADAIFRELASQAIDVEALPIMRHVLIKVADDQYRLARVVSIMLSDGFSSRMLDGELATLYEARLNGREPPLPREAHLQYADYSVWQRQVAQHEGPYLKELSEWWKSYFSIAPSVTGLPLKRLFRHTNLDPSEGILGWTLEGRTAQRFDEISRSAGTTPFIIRLAAFAALIADVTGNSTVVFWTLFDNRNRMATQTLAGPLVNIVPLVLPCDPSKTFLQWLKIIHHRVFEILAHGELPFDRIREQLQTFGIRSPQTDITFMLSRENSDQHFGGISISTEPFTVGTMPRGCTVYVDAKKSENCQIRFDANNYSRRGMSALLDLYLRLLVIAAREPNLPVDKLLKMAGAKQPKWICRKYTAPICDFLFRFYAAAPVLKMFWRPIRISAEWLITSAAISRIKLQPKATGTATVISRHR
jgi:amino acid adenylation domain-containing protein